MKLNTYIATVLVTGVHGKVWITTQVRAESVWFATQLLEAQYGRGCVCGIPLLVADNCS